MNFCPECNNVMVPREGGTTGVLNYVCRLNHTPIPVKDTHYVYYHENFDTDESGEIVNATGAGAGPEQTNLNYFSYRNSIVCSQIHPRVEHECKKCKYKYAKYIQNESTMMKTYICEKCLALSNN